ncbi:dynein axonemal intermediate chain 7 homolog isoform X2 [Haliotis asinina]|uniref:dynein axonemal intermediate chain 7 homolog isoform X2 n=1 Tax=Haliotis asinina TaxID=109174 RepID=UPI0035318ACF
MADEPPKKDGKKKLTKADKEKLKREEAERKAQEEEEARLQAVEEEKKRKQQEKLEAAERKKLENEEKKIRKIQMAELQEILQGNRNNLQRLHDDRRKKAKWARYMRCDGSPDPTIPGEINTYINLRLEETTRTHPKLILKDIELDLSLIAELEYMLTDTPLEELTDRQVAAYKETIEELQEVIRGKLDRAVFHVLCDASTMQDPETYNLQFVIKNPEIQLCIWGNLSKNPKVKSFEFQDVGFTFDIPRVLALSDCSFQVRMTKYDHYSMYSKTFSPRLKKKEEVVPEPVEETEEKPEEEEEKKEGEEGAEEEAEADREDTEDLMAQLRKMDGGEEEEEEQDTEKKEEVEEEEEDFEDPSTPEPPEWEDFEEDDDVVDLRAYNVLGGVFSFDLMALPPQPKAVNQWTLTRLVNPPQIELMEYVAELPAPAATSAQTKDQKDTQTQEKDKRDAKPPIGVTIKLPSDVMFQEEPQVVRWDEDKKHWRLDGFSDIVYNEENRTFSFKMYKFGIMALIQETHINMPFQSWELRPRAVNKAVLSIIAAIVELDIEIENSMCCLSTSFEDPALRHLKGQMMTPADLIQSLRKAGVNVFPSEDSSKYVSIQNKHPVLESRTYEQMALTASAMAYSWSKWNQDKEADQIIFQGSEHLSDERLLEEDWTLFQAGKRQVKQLTMTEFDEVFTEESKHPGTFKSNLYHLIVDTGSEEAKDRIYNSSYEFVDCVQQLLEATKVLTYS